VRDIEDEADSVPTKEGEHERVSLRERESELQERAVERGEREGGRVSVCVTRSPRLRFPLPPPTLPLPPYPVLPPS
jgi:hypothetical protein